MSNHQNKYSTPSAPPIAVVGVSALFPGSTDTRGFWRDIMEGRNQIKEVPPEHWLIEDYYDPDPSAQDKTYGNTGAFMDPIAFDSLSFGVPPNAIQHTDTSQLLGMLVAQKVLEDAAEGAFPHVDKSRISVILGATGTTELGVHLGARLQKPIWLKALRENGVPEDEAQAICSDIAASYVPWTEASFPGMLGNVIAGRIANKFDLGGTNCVVDAACASSLSALSMGMSELYLKQSDMVIVGGVDTLNDVLMYMCFSKTPALSPTGDCRPFSDQADGTIMGEGLGMLALRRLEDAERDGDNIYAVIRGVGSSSDGKGTAIYAPKASGQAVALQRAYEAAGYSPRTVELLEAHGTATKAGDAAEFQGAASVFAEADPNSTQWCAIGSIKSQIGHTKGAAGSASLIKVIMALHHKTLPPTIKVDKPNAKLDVDSSPFYINTQARPWVRDHDHPRRAGVSSFGFGGSNFHVTLEEYTGRKHAKGRFRTSPTELFLVSGETPEQVMALAGGLTEGFVGEEGFQFLARESQLNFLSTDRVRLAVVAKDFEDLRSKLDAATHAIQRSPDTAQRSPVGWGYSGTKTDGPQGQIAFLFPGQGSQYVGMGADLALSFADIQAIWDQAAELEFESGERLQDVVFPIPVFSDEERAAQETKLRATDWAQPAIGVSSLGYLTLLTKLGVTPDCVGGHSFGEVTALYAAGTLDRKSFFNVARKRGELMAEASEMFPGAMTAVFHDADRVTELLNQWDTGVVVANHNGPEQVVISGITSAIESAESRFEREGIRFRRLPVSTAFHSPVVRPAAAPFQSYLDNIHLASPWLPVYANSTAALYPTLPEAMRETLARQIARPVRFEEQIEAMYDAGVRTFVEVGPGTVLANLVNSCLNDRPHTSISLDRKGQHGLTSLWHALAQLAVLGTHLDLASLWDGVVCGDDTRLRKAPKLAIDISGVNYNKPYPPEGGAAALPAPNPPRGQSTNGHAASNGFAGTPVDEGVHTAPPTAPPVAPPAAPAPASPPAPVVPVAANSSTTQETSEAGSDNAEIEAPMVAATAEVNDGANAADVDEWVSAIKEMQQKTLDAHLTFLHMAEQSMQELTDLISGQLTDVEIDPVEAASAPVSAPVQRVMAPPPSLPSTTENPAGTPPAPFTNGHAQPGSLDAPAPETPTPTSAAPIAPTPEPVAPTPQPTPTPAAPAPTEPAPASNELHETMLEVVTEKTGYPTEMLEPGMSLANDLGIDSIKRVEILAAMRERVPSLPEFDPTEMGALNTLGEIVDYMNAQLGSNGGVPAPAQGIPTPTPVAPTPASVAPTPTPTPAAPAPTEPAPASNELHETMLEVVTEKTGYPTEMLEPGMSLANDLGIDSIKRVEILAAMRERVPSLPEFDPTEMGALNTLGEIVDYMNAQLGSSGGAPTPTQGIPTPTPVAPTPAPVAPTPQPTPTPAAPAPTEPAPASNELHETMLEVVTEKTGYPTEMLEPGMSLANDLGIDSIKRVEILAAMRERVPSLPEFDPTEMGALNTLGEIVDYMNAQLGSNGGAPTPTQGIPTPTPVAPTPAPVAPTPQPTPTPAAPAPTEPAPASNELHETMLEVVTEKTGYPTEMLEPGMSLANDLGIDSIKRVEILAAMRERVPSLPEFDPTEMGALNTLGEIVDYMNAQLGSNGVAPASTVGTPTPAPVAPTPQPTPTPAAPAPTEPAPASNELHETMLEVVTEKTGYPTEMLEPGMSLANDLGIDSIKRVEILAAMRERVPSLPEFDPTEMGALNTLGEIVDYMNAQLGSNGGAPGTPTPTSAAPVAPTPQPTPTPAAPAPTEAAPASNELHETMLEVVTEKTGYPTEMLEPGMSLANDLGIDSIKRVEILAAMRERVPSLPEFDPTEMGALNTLGEIVDYMNAQLGSKGGVPAPAPETPTPTSAVAATPAPSLDGLGRYVLQAEPSPAPGFAPPFLLDGTPVHITDDGQGVAAALAELLKLAGANAMVSATPPPDAQSVICLSGLRSSPDVAAASQASAEAFQIAAGLGATLETGGGLFVTVQDTGGDHGLAAHDGNAWLGGFSGLAKTAAQEWPLATVRSLDIGGTKGALPQAVAERLAVELLTGGSDLEIGLPASGERMTFSSVLRNPSGGPALVDNQSVIVVSGGGRGVTATTVIELARQTGARLALLGRSAIEDEPDFLSDAGDDAAIKRALLTDAQARGEKLTPRDLSARAGKVTAAREIRATLAAIQAAGADARYMPCDVTDAVSTGAALQSVRELWGPITGIVHGAGVLADKRLAEKTPEDFQRVFGTKVRGLETLLNATANDPLTMISLFSSVAARTGNAGQADYAMANEVLNRVALAESHRRQNCVVKSIGWGPWEGGMVTPLLKAKFEEMGVMLIPLEGGARAFVIEVQHAAPDEVDVVIGGMPEQAPLIAPGQRKALTPASYDVIVSAQTHPYLRSHEINGQVVLPLVTVQEWFTRAATDLLGESFRGEMHKLRVLKGVPLPDFETAAARFRIELKPDGQDATALQAMLYDGEGVPRFAAQLVPQAQPGHSGMPAAAADWQRADWQGADLYGNQLFHGPDFAALQSVDRIGATGAEATLLTSPALHWPDGHWAMDPALIDGGLQLARMWGLAQLEKLTLPTTVERFVLHQPGVIDGPTVRCILQGEPIGQAGTRTNLWFIDDSSGAIIAELHGLEMYASSETPAGGAA